MMCGEPDGRAVVKGRVKWFNELKGFGLLVSSDGVDVHVTYQNIAGEGFRTISEGEPVEFEIAETPKGPQARNVKRIE